MLVNISSLQKFSDRFSSIISDAIKKRFDAEKNLSKNMEDKDRIEREFFKKREQVKSDRHQYFLIILI
jgi:hypothetical protein